VEDELNRIESLSNYGWPLIEGMYPPKSNFDSLSRLIFSPPVKSWTPVIAPSGLAYYGGNRIPEWNNSLILTTLKSQSLRILKLSGDGRQVTGESILFENQLGRLRSVITLPNGDIFFCTSNRDWNPQKGFPKTDDDKIYRLRKTSDIAGELILPVKVKTSNEILLSGRALYESYCASCHKMDGRGVPNDFPSLASTNSVNGEKPVLIEIVLKGLKSKGEGVKYESAMPAFDFLEDEQLAAILSYVRMNFGNQSSSVTAAELEQYRASK
jgi:mono/diheme cytochrome c family protein